MLCIWIWKQKFSLIWAIDFSPELFLLQDKNIFKILAGLFLLSMLRKKGQQRSLSFDKQSTQSTNEKYDEKLTSTQDLVSYSRNPSCFCYKPLPKAVDVSIVSEVKDP